MCYSQQRAQAWDNLNVLGILSIGAKYIALAIRGMPSRDL
jgi:hypothetical protein